MALINFVRSKTGSVNTHLVDADDVIFIDSNGNITVGGRVEYAGLSETVSETPANPSEGVIYKFPNNVYKIYEDNTWKELTVGSDNTILNTLRTDVDNKVDKVTGKGLSTNDFSDTYKDKIDSIGNLTNLNTTDKTSIVNAINEVKASSNQLSIGTISDIESIYNSL